MPLSEFGSSRSIDSNVQRDSISNRIRCEPPAQSAGDLNLGCNGAHRRRSQRHFFRRGNAHPRRERAWGARTPGWPSEKRSKASAEESRHEGRTNVPGGEFWSDLRRQSSGWHRIPKTLPGFLAHFIPTGRLGHARSVVHYFRQVAQALLPVRVLRSKRGANCMQELQSHTAQSGSATQNQYHPRNEIPRTGSGQMQEFNARRAKRDFGLDEDRGVCHVFGKPYPQPRVGQFLAVIE